MILKSPLNICLSTTYITKSNLTQDEQVSLKDSMNILQEILENETQNLQATNTANQPGWAQYALLPS